LNRAALDALAESRAWRMGSLVWLMLAIQRVAWAAFSRSEYAVFVVLCSRRWGKTRFACLMCWQKALQHPGAIIRYACPTKAHGRQFVRPAMRWIERLAPAHLRPRFVTQDNTWIWPNGSVMHLGSCESDGDVDAQVGTECHLAVVDEAGKIRSELLRKLVRSVILPQFLTTRGRVCVTGTPPDSPEHYFRDLVTQAIERGTGIDTFVVADLIRSWHTTVDAQVLNGTGNNGQFKGIRNSGGNAITYTATTPTTALLYSKLADAYQQVESNVFIAPTHWIMHPRRLAAILASSDTTGRPLAVPTGNGPMNAVAAGAGLPGYGNSGYSILGLPVVTDANVGTTYGAATNQDEIYCVAAPEMHLWEQPGSPFALSFDATGAGSLTVKSVVYGFGAFSAERYPLAASIISGTGLVAPTF